MGRGDDDPHQYLAPLLEHFLKIEYHEFRNIRDNDLERNRWDEDTLGSLIDVRMSLASLKTKQKRHFGNSKGSEIGRQHRMSQSLLETAVSELELLVSEYERAEAVWDIERRDELLNAQLKEARNATETASSVANLTKLAFLFIPLSFVASVFGMNIQQFNNGNVSLSAFFATAAIMSFLTLFPFLGLIDGEITTASIKLFGRSPLHGFWFLAFTQFHLRKTNRALCEERIFFYLSWERDLSTARTRIAKSKTSG